MVTGNLKYLAKSKGLSGRSSFAWAWANWANGRRLEFCLKFQKGFDFFCDPCATNVFFLTTTNPFWCVPPFWTNPSWSIPSPPRNNSSNWTHFDSCSGFKEALRRKGPWLAIFKYLAVGKKHEKTLGCHFKKNNRRGFKTHLVFGKVSEFLICLCILEFKVSVAPWKVQRGLHYRKSELVFRLDSKKNDKCVCVCHYNLQDSPRKWTSSLHHTTSPRAPATLAAPAPKPRPHVFPKPPQQTVETRQVLRLGDQLGP